MKRNLFVFLLALSYSLAFSQHNLSQKSSTVTYMKYSGYKALKNNNTTVIDSVGFKIVDNDTLINVGGYQQKGVRVAYEEKDSIFLERYKQLVYNKKYQKKEEKLKPTMKTWKTPLNVYFDKSVSKEFSKELIKFMRVIDKEVDSLHINVVKDKEKSNYFIYSINSPTDVNLDLRIRTDDGYYLSWNNRQNIYNCALKIDGKNPNKENAATKLKINFIRSLGYFYLDFDSTNCTSYFSYCKSDNKEFSAQDMEILKYHYSYGICKGTTVDTFEENHKTAKESLKKHHTKFYFLHTN